MKEKLHRLWTAVTGTNEHQMALNRFAAGLIVVAYNVWTEQPLEGWPLLAPALYLVLGCTLVGDLLARPVPSRGRRMAALLLDIGAVSYELSIGGSATAWLLPAYLWVVFGNGFRFGAKFLLVAAGLSIAGFIGVIAATPFWRHNPALSVGMVLSLTILPLYALALIRSLSKARQQAEQANSAKSLFLANVSHELRTPLNAIIGMSAMLETSKLDSDQLEMSQTISSAARSLLTLINGILDLSRIEAGRMPVAHEPFDLAKLLTEIRSIFLAAVRQKDLRLNIYINPDVPLDLVGDSRWLHEVLLNLVGNALKFTEHGNITLGVESQANGDGRAKFRFEVTDTGIGITPEAQERIFDTFTQADETIVRRYGGTGLGLAITRKVVHLLGGEIGVHSRPGEGSTFWVELDLTVGQAQSAAPNQFAGVRAFVSAERARGVAPLLGQLAQWGVQVERVDNIDTALSFVGPKDRPAAGCVLGIARERPDSETASFLELCQSQSVAFVGMREAQLDGLPPLPWRTAFASSLTLPANEHELSNVLRFVAGGQIEVVAEAKAPEIDTCYRILAADDNLTNQRVLTKILEKAGHRVEVVGDGEQALDALAEGGFDAAILDVNMPVVSGIEAAKIYRFSAIGLPHIPLIGLTADATPETRQRCLDAGMDACLVKPVEPAAILKVLSDLVQNAQAAVRETAFSAKASPSESAVNPKGRQPLPRPLDLDTLRHLEALGGEEFVAEIAETFQSEARARLADLHQFLREEDVIGFRDGAHAIKSIAANMGAQQLAGLCSPLQTISADLLHRQGERYLTEIEAEFDRVSRALAEHAAVGGAHRP